MRFFRGMDEHFGKIRSLPRRGLRLLDFGVYPIHAGILALCLLAPLQLLGQSWSSFIDPTRAVDWSGAGFTIPSYSVACATQPTLLTGTGHEATNATQIQNSLASCDATHNVVNIPAGTYRVDGLHFGSQGKQVLRGAGANSTHIVSTSQDGCNGQDAGFCMQGAGSWTYANNANTLPPSGNQQCSWTAGYTKGATSITLNSCPAPPPSGQMILLDQANDTADNSGLYMCDATTAGSCTYDSGSLIGRTISGINHSQIQTAFVTGVTGSGTGPYTVTISPGVYFTNIRSGATPGAWWSGFTQNIGLENLSIDATALPKYAISQYDCYQCWVKGVTVLNAGRSAIELYQSGFGVIRDSYFYQAQGHTSVSYNIELNFSSGFLVENNIMQQTTTPILINNGTGNVVSYNFGIDQIAFPNNMWPAFVSHGAGNEFNLWEGNNFGGLNADDSHGSSGQQTYFRNMLTGWQSGRTLNTVAIVQSSYDRNFNMVGNILGQPGYHNQYQAYGTGNTTISGSANAPTSIYNLGLGLGGTYSCGTGAQASSPFCDALVFSTTMRWGNYDTVTSGVKWDATEASPGAVTYVAANFSSGYFGTLAHTLPSSLYYSSTPSWWPSGKTWPPIGPNTTTGNVGECTGTYAGAQATNSSQCPGGTLSTAWASHVVSIPAQDCFLSIGGPPDGTGSVLSFDASTCYGVTPSFSLTVVKTGTGTGNVTGTNCASATYPISTSIGTCTATPSAGSTLTSFVGTGSASCSGTTCPAFSITTTSTITANFQGTAATPAFSPAAGTYTTPQFVTISSSTPGATIYYTVDGSTPSAATSAIYKVPLYIYASQTLKALAVAPGWTNSAVGSSAYVVAKQKTRFSMMRSSQTQTPVPFPVDDRMQPSSGVRISNIEAVRGTYVWTTYDAWVASTTSHASKVVFTYQARPNWMTGLGSLTDGPPTDLNTVAACQNVLTGTTTDDCAMKEFTTAHMMHVTGLSTQPVAPVACPNLSEMEAGNEVNTFSGHSSSVGWSGTPAQFVKMSDDVAEIKAKWCTSATAMKLGSVSAVVGSNGTGNPQYDVYMAALIALVPQADQGLYQGVSFHNYSARDDFAPEPPPTGLASYSGTRCTSGNTPNSSCYVSIASQVGRLQTAALNTATWSPHLPIFIDEGGLGKVSQLNGDNNFGIAYVSEFTLLTAADPNVTNGVPPVNSMLYLADDHTAGTPCASFPTNWGCYWTGPWYDALQRTTSWLSAATTIGAASTSSITGGTKWTVPLNGGTSEITFCAVQNPTTCTASTSFTHKQDITGAITTVSGTVTLNSTASLLFNGATAITPTFSPVAGSYASTQLVNLSTTSGSVICYNTTGSPATNGTTGCTTGTLYTAPVSVSVSETLYAVAGGSGLADSPVGSAVYVINGAAATPTFSPVAGSYGASQSVTISSSTSGATICFTADGSTPTANGSGTCTHGTVYTGAVTVATSQTLKAIASKSTFTDSTVGSAAYTINGAVAVPTFFPVAGTYTSTQSVTLATATSGATICYTVDGSTPTASAGTCTHGTTYSTAISVSTTQTIKAIGSKSAFTDSSVASALYTITASAQPPVAASGSVTISGSVGPIN